MLKKSSQIKILAASFLIIFFMAGAVSAAASLIKPDAKDLINNQTQTVGEAGGYEAGTDNSALYLVQTVISVFLGVIGVLLLVYLLYAGYNWMTAQGEEEKVTKAKDTIKRAIVGMIIIIAAYAISTFVMSRIEAGTLKGATGGVGGYTSNP